MDKLGANFGRNGDIPNGGVPHSLSLSTMVIVDFQGTVSGPGKPTHIDLKIDNGQYKPVTSPHATSPG
jgi:hypothetical protein